MEASDSLLQKKIKFFCPILDTSTCLPAHVLQQYGEIRHEPENAAIPYGTQRHRGYDEYLYSSWLRGRTGRTAENGGTGTGKERGCG